MGKKFLRDFKVTSIVRPFEQTERMILRDYLALQRTSLANERTLFSYIRTSLYLVLGGIGLMNLKDLSHLRWLGYFALGLSVLLVIYGVIRYTVLRVRLLKYYDSIGVPGFDEEGQKG